MTTVTTLDLTAFFERFKVVQARSLDNASSQATTFNIFQLLGVARKENKTHSAFIAALLDPQGRHGQGMLFLTGFLDFCTKKNKNHPSLPVLYDEFTKTGWFVKREMPIESGRIDIVVQNPLIGYRVVIENKIDASEGQDQIQKYHQWLTKRENFYPHHDLIFLTPDGREANSGERDTYLKMSYHNDLAAWLSKTLPKIKAESVYWTVKQYISLASII